MNYGGLILLILGCTLASSEVVIELEQVARHRTPCRIKYRANASSHRAVWMFAGEYLNISFCLEYRQNVSIHHFTHSNDGGSDVISILLDGLSVGEVTTLERSNMGAYWNVFLRSDQVGEWREVEAGSHTVTLTVTEADRFGVEVDAVGLEMASVNVTADNIRCAGSTFMWGNNSGIGNRCEPPDVKSPKATGRDGVSRNQTNAGMTTRLSADVSKDDVTTRLLTDVDKGEMTTRLSADVSKDDVTTRLLTDVDKGELTTRLSADVSKDDVTTRLLTDVDKGELTTSLPGGIDKDEVATRMLADGGKNEVTMKLSADVDKDEVTTRLSSDVRMGEVTRLYADVDKDEVTTRLSSDVDKDEVTTRLSSDVGMGKVTTRLSDDVGKDEVITRLPADEGKGELTTRMPTDEDIVVIDVYSAPVVNDKLMTPPSLTSTLQWSNDTSNGSVCILRGHMLLILSHVILSLTAFIRNQII